MKVSHLVWLILGLAAVVAALSSAQSPARPELLPYQNPGVGVEQRIEDLLGRMTVEEKLDMLSGTGFDSKPNARLGIPALKMADGPQGVRMNLTSAFGPGAGPGGPGARPGPGPGGPGGGPFMNVVRIPATAFPAGICLAATWGPQLIEQVGRTIAQEAKALGRNMMLAPTVNINREPQGGRNFESFGEDPYLTSRIAVAYIKGVQGEGVIATVKHFAANNQEIQRNSINAKVDERVLHEIYFPAFRAAVEEAGVWSVMAAYNKLNGAWCAENPHLLTDVLKDEWGFKGFVVSDWGATHATVETANAGLDLEMPRGRFLTPELLLPAISSGQVKQAVIDDKVRRILRAMFSNGFFDRQYPADGPVDSPEQRAVARATATQGIVLLKNAGAVLPLGPSVRSIAVIGPNANVARVGGGGSATVRPPYAVSPLEGIRERAGSEVRVGYALVCAMEGEGKEKETPEARAGQITEATALAANSDVALVFAGDSARIESEGFAGVRALSGREWRRRVRGGALRWLPAFRQTQHCTLVPVRLRSLLYEFRLQQPDRDPAESGGWPTDPGHAEGAQ